MKPAYDLDKIKFATDTATFQKAIALIESGNVTDLYDDVFRYIAIVHGTDSYQVSVSPKQYDAGNCSCYLGQKDTLCKHMVAVAILAVQNGKPLSAEDKQPIGVPVCSQKLGELTEVEVETTKKLITDALRYIKAYSGPSRIWFTYQNSLSEGCNRLTKIVSELPVSQQTAKLLVNLLLRLDTKLMTGGVDDSDGTVGGFMQETVEVLKQYAQLDNHCIKEFAKLANRETCFGWEESLVKILDESYT